MSVIQALKTAREAGIELAVEGDELVWEADEEPGEAILDLLSRNKADLIEVLRPSAQGWSAMDWQSFFDERAGIAEHDGGFPRLDAEMSAFDDCVDQWLTMHPPHAKEPGCCLQCGLAILNEKQSSIAVACAGGVTAPLHHRCAADWRNLRRWKARSALMRLLPDPHPRTGRSY
jgi:hypothetical protein